jgi:beta-1,4-mannooligosaccharide/beta-1,4-mannosyl-N-acetylglucosamine phosphorylase
MVLLRMGNTPLITRLDIPNMPPEIVDPSSVFNPGAMRLGHMSYLLLRVQTRGRRTFTVPAGHRLGNLTSAGRLAIADRPVVFDWRGQEPADEVFHIYDARITLLESRPVVVTAVDTAAGCRLAVWETAGHFDTDFAGLEELKFLGWSAAEDSRNGVIFPEQVGGRYLMLERPNRPGEAGDPASGSQIVLSESHDLRSWKEVGPVMKGRFHYWDELIGAGPPPVKTRKGWLLVYHGVATHFASSNIYQAGAALLDLEDPTRVLGRTRDNILEPRESWELTGQVPNVVFPGGLTVAWLDDEGFAPEDARVLVYYGAADTVVGLAETTIGQLLGACLEHQ